MTLGLAACGGGGGGASPPALADTFRLVPNTCAAAGGFNQVGADDPFYVNSWHLENTGATQVVSASTNAGVAGIDASVKAVHQGGAGCTGKGVTLAVVDSGMELAHEDLSANVVAGASFDITTNGSAPLPVINLSSLDHGTAVAGIAVGRGWNGRGSRGTAPFASVVAYNLLGGVPVPFGAANVDDNVALLTLGGVSLADSSIPATSIFKNRADKVDIFNMSFGRSFAAAIPPDDTSAFTLGPKEGVSKLRGGLGAVYFQSAGNEHIRVRNAALPDGSTASFNCANLLKADVASGLLAGAVFSNLSEHTCGNSNQEPLFKPYVYSVAAIHNTGQASSYSSAGADIWVTGFGGEYGTTATAIITADSSGCESGYNSVLNQPTYLSNFPLLADALKVVADLFGASVKDPNCNYTGRMNGTSSSAPTVSGVAALMLEVNPNLTWRDVGYILAKTARKVDTSIATGSRATTFTASGATGVDKTIDLDKPWQVNSAGFNFQNRYGFGLVDAAAATALAKGFATPVGRRSAALTATGGVPTAIDIASGKYTQNSSNITFIDATASSGSMRVDIKLTNNTGAALNPGTIQFELVNNRTGQISILLPAFTSWYVGGKSFPLATAASQNFRFHTNAFFGDKLGDGFTVRATYIKAAAATSGNIALMPTLTSFSL